MMVLTVDEKLFKIYVQTCLILVLKVIFMTIYINFERFRVMAFDNEEDAIAIQTKQKSDEGVERIKRAFLNDVQNIPLFFIVGYLYILTNPHEQTTKQLFMLYAISRIAYTVVYAVFVIPQPARLLSFMMSFGILLYLTVRCLQFYC
ncbi:microsomal glutathione S-transferase 1 [Aethina tumida]|uniref:microsomal glutathione S-transferase 1 n=1 Tax=Aethina tumida TaxID=116153 RepID=UPI002149021C|nr:microsomal glutathione S-transferase 1 [Aethina tumida]